VNHATTSRRKCFLSLANNFRIPPIHTLSNMLSIFLLFDLFYFYFSSRPHCANKLIISQLSIATICNGFWQSDKCDANCENTYLSRGGILAMLAPCGHKALHLTSVPPERRKSLLFQLAVGSWRCSQPQTKLKTGFWVVCSYTDLDSGSVLVRWVSTNALFVRIYDQIKSERPWQILGLF